MNTFLTRNLLAILIFICCACLAPAAAAQNYSLDWYTLDAGGTVLSSGGTFGLHGTIAQVDGVPPGYGAPNDLRPGFWGGDPPCVSDLTGDYIVDLSDYFAFFSCFDSNAICADLDGSGAVDLIDFFAFFSAFDQSC